MVEPQAFGTRKNYWGARCLDAFSPMLGIYATMTKRGRTLSPSEWKKGLILGSTHIGDVLWRTCSLDLLKEGLPDCDWYYLASPDSAPLLENNPAIKGVLNMYLATGHRRVKLGAIPVLQEMQFDVALCTEKYQYIRDLLLAVRLKIPNRAAYTAKGFASLVTHPVPLTAYKDIHPKYIRDFFERISNVKSNGLLKPKIYLQPEEFARAMAFIESAGINLNRPVIAMFRKGRTSQSSLTDEQYMAAIHCLSDKYDAQTVLCGTRSERSDLELFASNLNHKVAICAGDLDLRSVAAFLNYCHCILTPDSGPRHIGNAVSTPVIYVCNTAVLDIENNCYCDNEVELLATLGLERRSQSLANLSGEGIASVVGRHMKPMLPNILTAASHP